MTDVFLNVKGRYIFQLSLENKFTIPWRTSFKNKNQKLLIIEIIEGFQLMSIEKKSSINYDLQIKQVKKTSLKSLLDICKEVLYKRAPLK